MVIETEHKLAQQIINQTVTPLQTAEKAKALIPSSSPKKKKNSFLVHPLRSERRARERGGIMG
jgi:hypothetical protein